MAARNKPGGGGGGGGNMETTRALTLPSNRSVYTGGVVAYEVSAGGVPRTGRIYPPPTSMVWGELPEAEGTSGGLGGRA